MAAKFYCADVHDCPGHRGATETCRRSALRDLPAPAIAKLPECGLEGCRNSEMHGHGAWEYPAPAYAIHPADPKPPAAAPAETNPIGDILGIGPDWMNRLDAIAAAVPAPVPGRTATGITAGRGHLTPGQTAEIGAEMVRACSGTRWEMALAALEQILRICRLVPAGPADSRRLLQIGAFTAQILEYINDPASLTPATKFVAIGPKVMCGDECVGTMKSKTFAKRTANALENHRPNREGV